MASISWVRGAPTAAQVNSYALAGTWIVGETITCTIGQKSVVYTVPSTTIATIVAGLVAFWNGLSKTNYPEFAEATAAGAASPMTLTADTAGVPFIVTVSTNSASGTITPTTPTPSAGPNDWSSAANWSGGAVPVTGDSVTIDRIGVQIYYGLGQSAVTLASLTINEDIDQQFILGLPRTNATGGYPEYRPQHLAIGATLCTITTAGGRTKIDFGSVATTCEVLDSGSGLEASVPAILLRGGTAGSSFMVQKGNVGLAFFAGDTGAGVVNVGQLTSANDATVTAGVGFTCSTITQYSGTLTINSAVVTSLTVQGGRGTYIQGTGAVAQLTATAAKVVYSTSGTLGGNAVLTGGSRLDFSQDLRAKTVTNPIQAYDSSDVNDPFKVVTSLVVHYNKTSRLGYGSDITLSRS